MVVKNYQNLAVLHHQFQFWSDFKKMDVTKLDNKSLNSFKKLQL